MPTDLELERLPEDVESERSLLATCCAPGMEERAGKIVQGLREADFMAPQHKALFAALRSLLADGTEVNALTLRDRLVTGGRAGEVGGFGGLIDLMAVAEVGRPEVLADLLRRKTSLRQLIKEGARLVREASEEDTPPEDLGRAASARIMEACGTVRGLAAPRQAWEVADEVIHADRTSKAVVGFPFDSMDRLVGGLHPGNLFILAARPGIGKTSLALQMALDAARRGQRAGFWTLEMSHEEVIERLGCISGYMRPQWTRRPLGDTEMAAALSFRDFLRQLPLDICDDASASPAVIRAALATAAVQREPYSLFLVDYLQLMSDDDPDRARRQNEAVRVGAISRALKVMAKDFHIPAVVMSQLSRDIEKGQDRPPRLSDLRDSGSIEADADQVGFIHRKWVEGQPEHAGSFVMAKNRHNPAGRIAITFRPDRLDFQALSFETAPVEPSLMDSWD